MKARGLISKLESDKAFIENKSVQVNIVTQNVHSLTFSLILLTKELNELKSELNSKIEQLKLNNSDLENKYINSVIEL